MIGTKRSLHTVKNRKFSVDFLKSVHKILMSFEFLENHGRILAKYYKETFRKKTYLKNMTTGGSDNSKL